MKNFRVIVAVQNMLEPYDLVDVREVYLDLSEETAKRIAGDIVGLELGGE